MSYVLVETFTSKQSGRTHWFQRMTGIGPMATADPDKAAVFLTEDGARRCPALWHPLSFYEVQVSEFSPAEPGATDRATT